MAHDHDHDPDHAHGHGHHHNSHHGPDAAPALPLEAKLRKILAHWRSHNAEHAETYRQWARNAKDNGMPEIGELLDQAAELTLQIDPLLARAQDRMPPAP